MNVAGRNAPLSPVSLGGSEWSYSKYQGPDDGPFPNNRGNLASPPNSGGSNGKMSMNGFPSGPRSTGGPSPPASVGRSSNGANMYARSDAGGPPGGGPGGPRGQEFDEGVLGEHYITLKNFLNSRDSMAKGQPNKARDKLLRLSPVQFYELSTDVYDELIRRQAVARMPPNAPKGPPTFLLPEKMFHPKRNQARQRLSSLGPPRFRDLAADVFHELERRFPRFQGGDIPRVGSSMSMRGGPMNRTGTPVNGAYPPRGQSRMRRPSDASSMRGPPPPDAYSLPPSPNLGNGEYGRPMQKQFNQNNTIVPNKSTMLEEDDGAEGSEADKKLIEDYQAQIRELREKLEGMETDMKKKDDEISRSSKGEKEWTDLRTSLEGKLSEAETLNVTMKQELERLRDDHDQLKAENESNGGADERLQRENDDLRKSLQQQQQVTEEVRQEAAEFLSEMRVISQQSAATYEKQVELEKTVDQLEHEVKEWRNRYARTKTQLRSLKSASMGLSHEHDTAMLRDKGFLDETGLVKDVHVTKYQIAVDELLQVARRESPEKVTEAMKSVVFSVRRITKDVDVFQPREEDAIHQQAKLKARVSSTANNLITASKNFAAGAGLSPVSILDAAASHLTAAVVEMLRVAKIRTTPDNELEEEDDGTVTPVDSAPFFSPRSEKQNPVEKDMLPPPPPFQGLGGMRSSAQSSAYSPINSPRESVEPYANGTTNGYGGRASDYHVGSYGGY